MGVKSLLKKYQARVNRHYVKKEDFERLQDDMQRLGKTVSSLKKCCEEKAGKQPEPVAETPRKTETESVKATAAVTGSAPDDLKRIKGIGPVLEKKLHKFGVTRFAQIANWTGEDIEKYSVHLNFKGRIEREEWIRQAKELD